MATHKKSDIPEAVWQELYDQLHEIAARQMRHEQNGSMLQTTAVLHEAYMRLRDQRQIGGDRSSFLAAAANTMRRVLIDNSRGEKSQKRGGEFKRVELCDNTIRIGDDQCGIIELHEALQAFAEFAPQEARMVEMIAFGGMTGEEVAAELGISASTIDRRVRTAKAWLRRELSK